ncbi:MAG TPA: AAA family ATPase, partial [Bacteroidales bacterium]|nr:AAA family ATPase [Bacteroidales bacterium]
VVELIQVCYALSDSKTYNHETSALWLAAKQLHCSNLTLIVLEGEKKEIVQDDMTIYVIPALEWLLK